MNKVIEQVEARLKEKGMTQAELAVKLGAMPSNFNRRFRSGSMKIREFVKMCEVLEIKSLDFPVKKKK